MLESQTGARADLRFIACRDFEDETGRHQRPLARTKEQRPVRLDGGAKIHAGGAGGLVCGKLDALAVLQADEAESWGSLRWMGHISP